jgi:hypothetical protein
MFTMGPTTEDTENTEVAQRKTKTLHAIRDSAGSILKDTPLLFLCATSVFSVSSVVKFTVRTHDPFPRAPMQSPKSS